MDYEDKEQLLQDFYNFCMEKYNGHCKEEAVYEFLNQTRFKYLPAESGRKQHTVGMALDNIQQEWDENKDIHVQQRHTSEGIRSSQISALVAYLTDIGVINKDNVNDTNII